MNAKTQYTHIPGPVGILQIAWDEPAQASSHQATKGTAIIAHPNPAQGGTMDNKVITTLAKAFVECGYRAVRFNFRGIGTSEGCFDNGLGETQDLCAVIRAFAPTGPLALAGFSFGTYCLTHALQALIDEGRDVQADVQSLVLVGSAAGKFALAPLPAALHEKTLLLHAEADEVIDLMHLMDWARPQSLPVTVVLGGSHFFHGLLPLLKSLVIRHLHATAHHL